MNEYRPHEFHSLYTPNFWYNMKSDFLAFNYTNILRRILIKDIDRIAHIPRHYGIKEYNGSENISFRLRPPQPLANILR
jgi:hypothetical protein